ncbi:MAG: hypothetical protein J2P15_03705, partial [Micromonosporaceae bacterium]|nr:hypothetical protein [Micromonosporaceae bacterium]
LDMLLAGLPLGYHETAHTEVWVTRLYSGLRRCAPWRLRHAYQVWRDERVRQDRRVPEAVPLFGLGGKTQARRPMVALGMVDGAPELRYIETGSNAVLPRSLWELPGDLYARRHGWL